MQQITSKEYSANFQQEIQKLLVQMAQDLKDLQDGKHPQFVKVVETLEATRLRLLAVAEIQYQLAIQQAKHTLDFTKQQIDNDYQLGREDAREMVAAELRKKKKELRDILDKLQQQGVQCQGEIKSCNELQIPQRRKDRKQAQQGQFNFKLNENEAKQDLNIMANLAEEFEGKK
ncbi:Conserved_hypothetical protein [Hexamita inflata]|uniref:Uncharacterized protein n=1 Tax=Hexamita inflata TaxID=28002 RepID=A0AA86U1U6_9EUKA|nr:Conserved hypothetical protein [Hexamita inflata]